jgi:predicted small integral membrane protein
MTSEQVDEIEDLRAHRDLPLQRTTVFGWVAGCLLIVWVFYTLGCALFGMWRSFVWLKHAVLG